MSARTRWVEWGGLGESAARVGAIALALGIAGGCADRDPYKPLSADEGERLLRDVRSDRGRVQDLTPAERAYLKGKMAK